MLVALGPGKHKKSQFHNLHVAFMNYFMMYITFFEVALNDEVHLNTDKIVGEEDQNSKESVCPICSDLYVPCNGIEHEKAANRYYNAYHSFSGYITV